MSEELPVAAQRVQNSISKLGGHEAVYLLPESTATALDAARALGVPVARIGKTIVFLVGGDVVATLIGGEDRVSEEALSAALMQESVTRLPASRVKEETGFPIGGVSPFALPIHVKLLLDQGLTEFDYFFVAAGHPKAVIRTTPGQVIEWARAKVAQLAEPRKTPSSS